MLLPYKVPEGSALSLLVRLFFFGEDVPASSVSSSFPKEIALDMLNSGMLQQEGDRCVPACMLTHLGDLLLSCDSVRRAQSRPLSDLVLGVNAPTHILGKCMLRLTHAGDVLDLGTGCGTLALHAATAGHRVIGTDLNPRALEFTLFNAALNGISNIEVLVGDRFEPVKDRHFDLIVCNRHFSLDPVRN